MPQAYGDYVRTKVAKDESDREQRLAEMGAALRTPEGEKLVREGFLSYVASLESFLETHGLDARPVSNRELRFERFVTSRTKALSDRVTIQRQARSVTITGMPDIWGGRRCGGRVRAIVFRGFGVPRRRYHSAGSHQVDPLKAGRRHAFDRLGVRGGARPLAG